MVGWIESVPPRDDRADVAFERPVDVLYPSGPFIERARKKRDCLKRRDCGQKKRHVLQKRQELPRKPDSLWKQGRLKKPGSLKKSASALKRKRAVAPKKKRLRRDSQKHAAALKRKSASVSNKIVYAQRKMNARDRNRSAFVLRRRHTAQKR